MKTDEQTNEDRSEDLLEESVLNRALPSSCQATLNYTERLYLYWLTKVNLNKAEAYYKSHPESKPETAKKNVARFDRNLRLKDKTAYQKMIDDYNKRQLTDEEEKFKQALVEHPKASKQEIMRHVRPELRDSSKTKAYNRLHQSLTVKDPDWRNKLSENYNIDAAFERLADLSMGRAKTYVEGRDAKTGQPIEIETNVPVSPETQRKTIMDMLAFTGMRAEETALDVSRKEAREKYGNVINQILNINVYEADN